MRCFRWAFRVPGRRLWRRLPGRGKWTRLPFWTTSSLLIPGWMSRSKESRSAGEMRASVEDLQALIVDARTHTFDLVRDLSDEQFRVPLLRIINPFLWEIGHVAYFQEFWVLRHAANQPAMMPDGDALYDSAKVAHDTRWNLPLPSRDVTIGYLEKVRDRVIDRLASPGFDEREAYFVQLSVFHEDMHDEAFTYTRQTLGYPPPQIPAPSKA